MLSLAQKASTAHNLLSFMQTNTPRAETAGSHRHYTFSDASVLTVNCGVQDNKSFYATALTTNDLKVADDWPEIKRTYKPKDWVLVEDKSLPETLSPVIDTDMANACERYQATPVSTEQAKPMTLNELATMAAKGRKGNKKECFNIVKELATETNPEFREAKLSILYSYFMPSTPKMPKTEMDWCQSATAKKDVREYLQYVYVNANGRMSGTDGHRVHIVENSGMAEGYYDKAGNKVDLDYKYPDIDRIIKKHTKFTELASVDIDQIAVTDKGINTRKIQVNGELVVHVQKDYYDQAVVGFDQPTMHYTDKTSCIQIEEGSKIAVIMPIRV